MKQTRVLLLALVALVSACAHLSPGSGGREKDRLWREAHLALAAQNFRSADSLFAGLAASFPESEEGREAHFYLGAMRLDPRNEGWSSQQAAEHLRRYLAGDTASARRTIFRKPEAGTLLELANQLNMPAESRVPALQPDTVVRTVPGRSRRVVVPAEESRELSSEVARLRRELAEREETIRRQREELNRIRNTLAPGRRPP